jgi:hypothetical protein
LQTAIPLRPATHCPRNGVARPCQSTATCQKMQADKLHNPCGVHMRGPLAHSNHRIVRQVWPNIAAIRGSALHSSPRNSMAAWGISRNACTVRRRTNRRQVCVCCGRRDTMASGVSTATFIPPWIANRNITDYLNAGLPSRIGEVLAWSIFGRVRPCFGILS